jgi:hypothetical protein
MHVTAERLVLGQIFGVPCRKGGRECIASGKHGRGLDIAPKLGPQLHRAWDPLNCCIVRMSPTASSRTSLKSFKCTAS